MDILTYGALNKKVGEKLSSNQGTQNAGKMLGINNEGKIQPIQVLGGNVSVTETLESGEDYSMEIEEGEPTAVNSVAGKYGTVTLDAGDIEYDEQEVYNSGTVGKEVGDLKSQIDAEYTVPLVLTAGKYIKSGSIGTDFTTLFVDNGSSVYTAASAYIPSDLNGKTLRIYWDNHDNSSARKFGFCDAENKIVSIYSEDTLTYSSDDYGVYVDVPIVSNYMFFSTKTSFGFKKAVCRYNKIDMLSESIIGKTAYVSRTGSDDNAGDSPNAPLATINKALEKGYNIIRVFGSKFLQKVDFSKAKSKNVTITAYERDNQPIFMDASAIVGTSATAVSGYTKVKKITKTKSIPTDTVWIYQDSVNDVSTLISDSERHPLQRGKMYRCDDTKIVKCTADNLSDALAEIEAATTYKWYKDGNDWYFSCPDTVTSNKPICAGVGNSFFGGLDRSMTLNISGIAVKYMSFNISGTVNSDITDCKCSNVTDAGAFRYDNCLNAKFLRCEAEHCAKGGNGDGFNAHATGVSSGPFVKCSTGIMVDCWSHDNFNDGYSNHDRGEDTIIGGLFEYNGIAGITPSYGTHCTCYDVLSRQNYSGFYCIGVPTSAEGGVGTQLICYGCVAQDNYNGGLYTGFYVAGAGNSMMLYNCKSIANNRGYRAAADTTMLLVDCTALDNHAEVKYGDGTITVKNTTAVT